MTNFFYIYEKIGISNIKLWDSLSIYQNHFDQI